MQTPELVCADVQAWLQDQQLPSDSPLHQALAAHVAGCALCRGAWFTMLNLAWGDPAASMPCTSCQEELAEFVEAELRDPLEALRSYPALWQHLWTCASCRETYDDLVAVLEADPELLEPLAWAPQVPEPQPGVFVTLLTLLRRTLDGLPTPLEFSAVRRGAADEYLVRPQAPYAVPGLEGAIYAFYNGDDTWTLEVAVNLEPGRAMRLELDTYAQTVAVTADGLALFTAIPTSALLSETADLHLAIAA